MPAISTSSSAAGLGSAQGWSSVPPALWQPAGNQGKSLDSDLGADIGTVRAQLKYDRYFVKLPQFQIGRNVEAQNLAYSRPFPN